MGLGEDYFSGIDYDPYNTDRSRGCRIRNDRQRADDAERELARIKKERENEIIRAFLDRYSYGD